VKLKDALKRKKFVVTSEIQAPMSEDKPEKLIEDLKYIKGRMDGVSVMEVELEGIVGDSIKTCEILQSNRFNAIYQTTTRDKNRIQLQKDLTNAHVTGVENLLFFTEDYRITGDSLQETMFFHVDSGKLESVLNHIKAGHSIDGNTLDSKIEFVLGSGVETPWGKNVPKKGMQEMETMGKMGTEYFLTTPIFDLDQFERFITQVKPLRIPVIAEVMILKTAGMARFINRHFKSGLVPDWVIKKLSGTPDLEKASINLFADTVKGLKDLCQGVHIITFGGVEKLKRYMDAAKLK
jgi:methylenetetrahydrofolate reductase (NADPH)